MPIRFYEVGGCIRDEFLGIPSKDVDFSVEADSYAEMREHLVKVGFKIYVEKPEHLTIRAMVPEGHILRERTKDADFVLCRKDGSYSDGRRPDFVTPGTILDDLARRDFTMNAMARTPEGEIIDPHKGRIDLNHGIIRFVGDPRERIAEDGLRVLRGFRFAITKGLDIEPASLSAMLSPLAVDMLRCVSVERIREEMEKMLRYDSLSALSWIGEWGEPMRRAVFREGLRFSATLAK